MLCCPFTIAKLLWILIWCSLFPFPSCHFASALHSDLKRGQIQVTGSLDVFTKQSLQWLQWTYMCNNRYERMSEIYLRQRHMVMLCASEEMRWERNGVLLLLCAICSQQHSKASLPTKGCYFPFLERKMEIQTEILLLPTTQYPSFLSLEGTTARKRMLPVTPLLEVTTSLWLPEVVSV